MEEMLQLQSQIRARKEKERLKHVLNSEKYKEMFKPITRTLEKFTPPPPPPKIAVKQPPPESETPSPPPPPPEPGILYRKALDSITRGDRDDGVLGLNVEQHRIGEYTYRVLGDTLEATGTPGDVHTFLISDINLWKLLLVLRPRKIGLRLVDPASSQFLPFTEQYTRIVNELHLVESAAAMGFNVRNRAKYHLIREVSGSGSTGSGISVHPSTVIIPSDREGLLRALYQAVAELRAGNKSMQNLVVPLAQEARRKKILPDGLLSPDEQHWVFS